MDRRSLTSLILVGCGLTALTAVPIRGSSAQGAGGRHTKHALLVGISNYDRGQQDHWIDLNSHADLVALKKVLIERWKFAEGEITVLEDMKATHKGIVDAFKHNLIDAARPGDVIFFHFSGHGQQVRDDLPDYYGKVKLDEPDGKDESLVPYDNMGQRAANGARTNIRDDEMEVLLGQLADKLRKADGTVDGNITVSMDSCHSGTMTRGDARTRGRSWDEHLDGPEPKPQVRGELKEMPSGLRARGGGSPRDYELLAACDDAESAYEARDGEGGAFTQALAHALAQAPDGATYRTLFQQASVRVTADYPLQHPQLEGIPGQRLFSGLVDPRPAYPIVRSMRDEHTVVLSAGKVHGASIGSTYDLFRAGTRVKEAKNRIATAELVQVDLTTSQARVTPTGGALKPEELLAAQAVETTHNYSSQQLRVLFEGDNTHRDDQELRELTAITTTGVTRDNYDVRVWHEPGKGLVLQRRGEERGMDPSLVSIPENDEAARRLRESLLGAWHWRFLSRLQQDAPGSPAPVEARLVLVDVKPEARQRGSVVSPDEILAAREPERTVGERIVIREGEFTMVEVRNPKTNGRILRVNILTLGPDGRIGPIFPHPEFEAYHDFGKIPADGEWHRIAFPFVFRMEPPFGAQLFKVIAIASEDDQFAVLSGLFFEPVATRGVQARGAEDKAKKIVEKIRGPANALANLLLDISRGTTRGPSLAATVQSDFWTTSDLPFEIRPRNAALPGAARGQ